LQEEIVPRLRSAIPRNVNQIGSEDAEELIQDAIVMAAKLLDNAERANKTVTPGNIAYYTILHMKSGRRSCGSSYSDVNMIGGIKAVWSLHLPASLWRGRWMLGSLGWDFLLFSYPLSEKGEGRNRTKLTDSLPVK
jgi:hypothetical protein